ncbi:MAG: polysaccharide biosynthesis tyrosine autokinase [Thermodesulfobacteriota bacterium]
MPTNAPNPTPQKVDLRDYWRILVKHRWIVITFLLVVVTTVTIYSLTMIPIYRATAQILIEKTNPNILSMQELVVMDPSGTDFYQTQYKILESRSIAQEVIKRLDLAQNPEFKGKKKQQEKEPLSETSSIPEPAPIDDSAIVGPFLKRLKIEPIRNSRLVNINFESTDPNLAAQAANTLAQAYIDWNLGLRLKTQQNVSNFLDEQVKEARRKLDASEQALQQYREKYGVAALSARGGKGPEGEQDISRLKLMQVNAQFVDATKNRIEAEIQYKNALEALKVPRKAESLPDVISNLAILAIKDQEVRLLRDRAEKSEKFGPKHPVTVSLNQEIENLEKKKLEEIRNIVDAMRTKYEVALNQERFLQKALMQSQDETISRDKIAIQYQVLQQETESNRVLYDMLLKRLKETNVSEENRTINIHVVDQAEVPKGPFKPKVVMNISLAVVVGLFLGIGLAFFMEYIDNTVKTPDDLKRYFNLPYLGPVPHFKIENPDLPKSDLIVLNDPKSSASESYRGIRTGILFSTSSGPPRSLLITSADAKEGKTITCSNLAIAMAQAGQRILMLDCDMHRPRFHKIFNLGNERGLSNILVGEKDWREVKTPTPIPNLEVIPSGPIPPNPADLIGSDRMRDLIKEAIQEYDCVLFDSAPVGAVTDPVILSRFVEGVVLVVKVGQTVRDRVANSLRLLKDVQAHVLGAVLNDINIGKDGYYYYYYHYYYYGEAGERKKKKSRHHKHPPSQDLKPSAIP